VSIFDRRLAIVGAVVAGACLWLAAVGADAVGIGGSGGYHARQIVIAEIGIAIIVGAAFFGLGTWRAVRAPSVRIRRPSTPVLVAGSAAFAFILVTLWWVLNDGWLPNGDAGRHLVIVGNYLSAVENGHLWRPLDSPPVIDEEFYPPFVHLVGVLGSLIAGFGINTGVMTLNLLFVPLLAVGCYGIGSYVYGQWAGALAVIFVLGAPLLIAQFHVFMLDASLTALVAGSVWLLLLSEQFSRTGIAALAGVVVGCGIMTKVTFPLFIAGVVLVLLLRNGWRNWRGFVMFLGIALLISQPWLLLHEDMLRDRAGRALDMQRENPHAQGAFGNYGAYFWGVLTVQLLLPLFLFFVVGFGSACWSAIRRKARNGELELAAGVVVGVIAVANMDWFNVRYDMPLLPYAAVLGVGWVTALRFVWLRFALATTVVVVALTNSIMVNTGLGGLVTIGSPFSSDHATLVSDGGYVENHPRPESWLPELLEGARDAGAEQVIFHPESLNTGHYNLNGLTVLGREAGLSVRPAALWQELSEDDIYVTRLALDSTERRPCIIQDGEYGIYVFRGGPIAEGKPSWCPPGWQQRRVTF
jgi:hypothetical protein